MKRMQIKNWLREKTCEIIKKVNIYEVIKIVILIISLDISIRNDNPNSKRDSGSSQMSSIKHGSIKAYEVVTEIDIFEYDLVSGQALIKFCTNHKEIFFGEEPCYCKYKMFLVGNKGLKTMRMYVLVIFVFFKCVGHEVRTSTLEPSEFIPMQYFNQSILDDYEPSEVCGLRAL